MKNIMESEIVCISTSHDSSISFLDLKDNIWNIELERIFRERYFLIDENNVDHCFSVIREFLKKEFGITCFRHCIVDSDSIGFAPTQGIPEKLYSHIYDLCPSGSIEIMSHHEAHALGALYLSPYNSSLVLSYDGGGKDKNGKREFFNIYHAKRNGELELLKSYDWNLGVSYSWIGIPLTPLKKKTGPLLIKIFTHLSG